MSRTEYKSAMAICAGLGVEHGRDGCHKFRERIFKRHLWLSRDIAYRYVSIAKRQGYREANLFLYDIDRDMRLYKTGLYADVDHQAVVDYADAKSKAMEKDIMEIGTRMGGEAALNYARMKCEDAGLELPLDIRPTDSEQTVKNKKASALARVIDRAWWRRNISKMAARRLESVLRNIGLVSRKRGLYVSDYTLSRRLSQKRRNKKLLESMIATNEDGYSATVQELAETGQANPVNRRNELMIRIRGYEEIAEAMDYKGLFLTITCPSRFHATLHTGFKNSKFDGSTPRDAQDYLNTVWSLVRSAWQKEGIRVFGFRIAEPHHDGTPHWHMLLFCANGADKRAVSIFEQYAVKDDNCELIYGNEPRFKAIEIDPGKGTAAGYIAKYVSKNIDGFAVGHDEESGEAAAETVARVDAWAGCWGIRQFQQIGSVSVTVYRELRRGMREDLFRYESDDMKAIAEAAEAADWAKFCELMGGALVGRKEQPIRPLQVLSDEENKYGELFKRIRGIVMRGTAEVITRVHEWHVSRAPLVEGAQSAAARTCVNNCTESKGGG